VIATVITEMGVPAVAAAVDVSAIVRGAPPLDRVERAPVILRHALPEALAVLWTVTADDIRQFQDRGLRGCLAV
jgi:hypothetical protein